MPRREVHQVRPTGWANPQDEWRRMSPLDYGTYSWENWIIIFKVADDADPAGIVDTFRRGLAATLGQSRHAAGTIRKNQWGDYSIVTTPQSTATLVTLYLDATECLSYGEWERQHNFCCEALLDNPSDLVVFPRSSPASPATPQPTMAFQLTMIPGGGGILGLSSHHWFMDALGCGSFIRQLAANCKAVADGRAPAPFDETLMDRARFLGPPLPDKARVDVSPPPPRNRQRLPCVWLLFRLPLSKAAELKAMATEEGGGATPERGGGAGRRISTYDAVVALLWRIVLRNRATIYQPRRLRAKAILGEPVNMRTRVQPPVPADYQGVMACGALSLCQKRPLTVGEVMATAPLPRVAAFVRRITDSVDAQTLAQQRDKNARARDKLRLHKTLDWLPPLSLVLTDWRGVDVCGRDFGFATSVALRSPADAVVGNLMMLYPRRRPDPRAPSDQNDDDHGWEIVVPFEEAYVDRLLADPDLNRFFVFCGYEARPKRRPAQTGPGGGASPADKLSARERIRDRYMRLKTWVFLNVV